MNTKEPALPATVLSLSARFATKVGSLGLTEERIQRAIDDSSDPLWMAVTSALCSPPEKLVPRVETVRISLPSIPAQQVMKKEQAFVPRIYVLSERPKPCAQRSADDQVTDLKRMYQELRWAWTESGLVIPKPRNGFDRLIVLADPALTNNRVFGVCKNSFPSWRYENDLDFAVPADKDQRHPSRGVYAIRVRDLADSDDNLRNLSANMIAGRDLKTMTLLERMLLELVYFRETGKHLDSRTWTLCAGSRSSGGGVPCAYWFGDLFRVDWGSLVGWDPVIRARQAVTL